MARALAVAFLWGFALVFIALTIAGCAKPDQQMDWGSLARELQKQQGN